MHWDEAASLFNEFLEVFPECSIQGLVVRIDQHRIVAKEFIPIPETSHRSVHIIEVYRIPSQRLGEVWIHRPRLMRGLPWPRPCMPKEEHPNGTVFIIRLTQWH